MKVRTIINLAVGLFLITNIVFAEIVPLPNIMNPDIIEINGHDMVLAEGASISIYSLKDFKLIKKFGEQGEGPQEFKVLPMVASLEVKILPEYIVINSIGKVSTFTREGQFIKEKKITDMARMIPFQEKFVGVQFTSGQNNGGPEMAFNIYDSQGKKIKSICTHKLPILKGKGTTTLLDLLSQVNPQYKTSRDRIFIAGKQIFEIDIYDQEGNFLKSIKREIKKQKLTGDDREKLLQAYKIHPLYKLFWERIKEAVKIPDYLPVFKTFLVSDEKVYVQTFNKSNDKTEFLIFDLEGKFIKSAFLPLVYENIVTPYLYTISRGKIYQLSENEDEEWELQISGIE
ncbi:MAG: hypothetical protein PVH61_14360 [Candidatus Aminicenantes bacterium]|jgi:hypothetical protein